ncbi:MAG: hypothetical protein ACREA5_06385 [Nitrosotalea sp.]
MSKETVEHMTSVENVTKEKLTEVIKSGKKEHDSSGPQTAVSMCDIMKDNTSEIMQKMNSKIPTYIQLYSDLYKKYLLMTSHFYDTCYIAGKELLGKTGMDDTRSVIFDGYWKSIKQMVLFQIDINENMTKSYVQYRLSVLDSCDDAINQTMTNFSKI